MRRSRDGFAALIAVVVVPAGLAAALCLRGYQAGSDYVQFHAAARLLAAGGSPYDPAGQARIQGPLLLPDQLLPVYRPRGFLPYFYPPWLALVCWPLARLPYHVARTAWVYLMTTALALSAWHLGRVADRLPRSVWLVLALSSFTSLYCLQLGQVVPLVLVAAVATEAALDNRRDRLAGAALAWTTIKPQLVVVLVPALLLWAARQRRWGVWLGFGGMLGALALACSALDPGWPVEMVRAMRRDPIPSEVPPYGGVTWSYALRLAGHRGATFAVGVAALALPALALALREAVRRGATALDVLGVAAPAAFVVSPYAQVYDFPLLLLPVAALTTRRTGWAAWVAPLALYAVPTVYAALARAGLPVTALLILPAFFLILVAAQPARDPR